MKPRKNLRIEPYDPNPIDRDGDGIVQEGTAWERPFATRLLDALGKEIAVGLTSDSRPQGARVVNEAGEDVAYMASYEAGQSLGRSLTERGNIGQVVGGTLGENFGTLDSAPSIRKSFPRGVNVRQQGTPGERKKLRERIVGAFELGKKWEKLHQKFSSYDREQKEKMLEGFDKYAAWLKKIAGDETLSPEERMENIIQFMVDNAEELAKQANMVDADGNLTEKAQIARQWYKVANHFNSSLADEAGIRAEAVHAATAIFSAKTDWEVNTAIAANAVRLMKDNPVITEADGEMLRESKLVQLKRQVERESEKLKELQDEVKKIRSIINDTRNYALEVRKEAQIELAKKIKTLEKQKKTTEDYQKELKDLKSFKGEGSGTKFLEYYGGKVDDPLRNQPSVIGGRYISEKEAELRTFRFNVNEDGSYDVSVMEASAKSGHAPETEHRKVFEVLRAAFNGDDLDLYDKIQNNLGEGNKVRSFYNNMSDPDDINFTSVTIDTHHAGLLLGIPYSALNDDIKKIFKDPDPMDGVFSIGGSYTLLGAAPFYASMKEATERFAEKHGLLPREAQSVLWEAQRQMWNTMTSQEKGDAKKRMHRLTKDPNLTAEQMREELWKIHEEKFAKVKEKEPKFFTGDVSDMLPESIKVQDNYDPAEEARRLAQRTKKPTAKKKTVAKKKAPAKSEKEKEVSVRANTARILGLEPEDNIGEESLDDLNKRLKESLKPDPDSSDPRVFQSVPARPDPDDKDFYLMGNPDPAEEARERAQEWVKRQQDLDRKKEEAVKEQSERWSKIRSYKEEIKKRTKEHRQILEPSSSESVGSYQPGPYQQLSGQIPGGLQYVEPAKGSYGDRIDKNLPRNERVNQLVDLFKKDNEGKIEVASSLQTAIKQGDISEEVAIKIFDTVSSLRETTNFYPDELTYENSGSATAFVQGVQGVADDGTFVYSKISLSVTSLGYGSSQNQKVLDDAIQDAASARSGANFFYQSSLDPWQSTLVHEWGHVAKARLLEGPNGIDNLMEVEGNIVELLASYGMIDETAIPEEFRILAQQAGKSVTSADFWRNEAAEAMKKRFVPREEGGWDMLLDGYPSPFGTGFEDPEGLEPNSVLRRDGSDNDLKLSTYSTFNSDEMFAELFALAFSPELSKTRKNSKIETQIAVSEVFRETILERLQLGDSKLGAIRAEAGKFSRPIMGETLPSPRKRVGGAATVRQSIAPPERDPVKKAKELFPEFDVNSEQDYGTLRENTIGLVSTPDSVGNDLLKSILQSSQISPEDVFMGYDDTVNYSDYGADLLLDAIDAAPITDEVKKKIKEDFEIVRAFSELERVARSTVKPPKDDLFDDPDGPEWVMPSPNDVQNRIDEIFADAPESLSDFLNAEKSRKASKVQDDLQRTQRAAEQAAADIAEDAKRAEAIKIERERALNEATEASNLAKAVGPPSELELERRKAITETLPSTPEEIKTKNKAVLDGIKEAGGSPFKVDEDYASNNTDRLIPPRTVDQAYEEQRSKARSLVSVVRNYLETKKTQPDSESYEHYDLLHPDVKQLILSSTDDELLDIIEAQMVEFHKGVSKNVRVRVVGGEKLDSIFSDGRYKTTHEAQSSHSQPGVRREYENTIGMPKDLAPVYRPASGYITHPDWTEDGQGLGAYGLTELILRPEVNGRTGYGTDDSFNTLLSPVAFGDDDPKAIFAALMPANGKYDYKVDSHTLGWLESARSGSFKNVNSSYSGSPETLDSGTGSGHNYFEALILGGFEASEIERVKIRYNDLGDISTQEDVLEGQFEDFVAEFLTGENLTRVGFSDVEIEYLKKIVDGHQATRGTPLPGRFAVAGADRLREFRAAQARKSKFEEYGIAVEVTYPPEVLQSIPYNLRGLDLFDPVSYGGKPGDDVETILKERFEAGLLKEVRDSMRREQERADRIARGEPESRPLG